MTMVKQNLDLTQAECRANAVKRMRVILTEFGVDTSHLTDQWLWVVFNQLDSARQESAAEGGYFAMDI